MSKATSQKKQPAFSLADRFAYGNFSIDEICELKKRGRTGFYEDLAAGLVTIEKDGRSSRVPGPSALKYITAGGRG
jgi:hypothetical protein